LRATTNNAIVIPEGLHQINLAVKAASRDYVTNNYHFQEKDIIFSSVELVLDKTPLAEMCTVKVQLLFTTLSSSEQL